MCRYAYCQFLQCGHRIIDVAVYCDQTLWRAGLAGQMVPCKETTFTYHLDKALNPETPMPDGMLPGDELGHLWIGLSGICKICTKLTRVPQSIALPTQADALLSTFSGLPVVNEISTNSVAHPVTEDRASPEHPFVYLPSFNSSVFELLGVSSHYRDADQSSCKTLFFPASAFRYHREKWATGALVNGREIEEVPNRYFFTNCGLTPLDRQFIAAELARGLTLEAIWSNTFCLRGVRKDLFIRAASRPEVIPPRRALIAEDAQLQGPVNNVVDVANRPVVAPPAAPGQPKQRKNARRGAPAPTVKRAAATIDASPYAQGARKVRRQAKKLPVPRATSPVAHFGLPAGRLDSASPLMMPEAPVNQGFEGTQLQFDPPRASRSPVAQPAAQLDPAHPDFDVELLFADAQPIAPNNNFDFGAGDNLGDNRVGAPVNAGIAEQFLGNNVEMIANNVGMVANNVGLVANNVRMAADNIGMVDNNVGMIANNAGMAYNAEMVADEGFGDNDNFNHGLDEFIALDDPIWALVRA